MSHRVLSGQFGGMTVLPFDHALLGPPEERLNTGKRPPDLSKEVGGEYPATRRDWSRENQPRRSGKGRTREPGFVMATKSGRKAPTNRVPPRMP